MREFKEFHNDDNGAWLEVFCYQLAPGEVEELILATNPNMEGEATAMYIAERVKEMGLSEVIKITRIGRGLPTGADIEFADGQTLLRAFEGRREM